MKWAIPIPVLLLVACGGKTTLPQCSWPSSLDASDAAQGQCRAARALVQCDLGGGVTEGGLSDDATRCSGGAAGHDLCNEDEYGAACGSVGPSQAVADDPPAGCRSKLMTPGGVAFFCCPCVLTAP